jgi:hypothetical protein
MASKSYFLSRSFRLKIDPARVGPLGGLIFICGQNILSGTSPWLLTLIRRRPNRAERKAWHSRPDSGDRKSMPVVRNLGPEKLISHWPQFGVG